MLMETIICKIWLDNVDDGYMVLSTSQDTNALVVNSVLPALSVSCNNRYDMNSICIPRKAGEASGAITKLTDPNGFSLIINVEYNQVSTEAN